MVKVLYLASGNPLNPQSGMDRVQNAHLSELVADMNIQIDAVIVAPGVDYQCGHDSQNLNRVNVNMFFGDLIQESSRIRRFFNKCLFALFRQVPISAYGFKSARAGKLIRDLIRSNDYDVVLVDHYYVFSNVDIDVILKSGARLLFLSHDRISCYTEILRGQGDGLLKRLYCQWASLRGRLNERKIFKGAALVVHLSEYEKADAERIGGVHEALLPPLTTLKYKRDLVSDQVYFFNKVLFIGSPDYQPNAEAIRWITEYLGPELARVAPSVEVALIGRGTEALDLRGVSNVKGYGFVLDSLLATMLRQCICAISPVQFGEGVKIKVLEALSLGCPVLATHESLRGFSEFSLKAELNLDSPHDVALDILGRSNDPDRVSHERATMSAKWDLFFQRRLGRLSALVKSIC